MEFYCAAITENGFFDLFSSVFSENNISRLYVIKGASGVGKSTLMKKLALEGESRGIAVDRIYCSSDPSSLDGVIVGDVGMIDGTPPHTYEPRLAGAFETLIDLGRFWKRELLTPHVDELRSLSLKKRAAFERIYELSTIHGKLISFLERSSEAKLDEATIRRYVRSLVRRRLADAKDGKGEMRIFSSSFGDVKMPPHEQIYSASDTFGSVFLAELRAELTERGKEFFFSPSLPSIERIETIYVPSLRIVYTTRGGGRRINGDRFFIEKPIEHGFENTISQLLEAIKEKHREAMSYHEMIERIYLGAMDFERMNEYTDQLFEEIFSYIGE
ncbi:MAG: hypothetical protein IJN75_05835 [Clostridia bacterium]|nr:hypothetical protein [Clostridia bacterium]